MNYADAIHAVMPRCGFSAMTAMANAMPQWQIDTPDRVAAFLAQIAVESLELTVWEEDLYYSAEALLRVWPEHFNPPEVAAQYAYRPAAIANRAYANRMGNGDEASGDGYKYRGRGPIQITGLDNYTLAGTALHLDLINQPDLLAEASAGCASACHFWVMNNCNTLADERNFEAITRAINGGLTDEGHRVTYLKTALEYLKLPMWPL